MQRYFKTLQIFVVFSFATVLLLPTINTYFSLFYEIKSNENKAKMNIPNLRNTNLDSLPILLENYFNNTFNLRNNFIMLHNKLEYNLFFDSPIKEVIVGNNGWFYDADNAPNYQGLNKFSVIELEQLKAEISKRTKWAKHRKIEYYVAVVPSKMNVYPEFLPARIAKTTEHNLYEQFVALNNDSSIRIIDVKQNLIRHKKNAPQLLYQKTDGHWNELGAYYGYQTIMDYLSKKNLENKPMPINDYAIGIEVRKGGALASMMNVENVTKENFVVLNKKTPTLAHDGVKRNYPKPNTIEDWDFETVKINEQKKLKCLIIRDSFTLLMMKYFQENFKEVIFIHGEWKGEMHEKIIETEKPDIVINIMFETKIQNLIKYPFNN